jgi:hydrogen peroxide-dependent heme synthase
MTELPAAPLTLEGAYVLHQMFRIRHTAWRALDDSQREQMTRDAVAALSEMGQKRADNGRSNQSAIYSLVGHKGDLMVLHFRDSLEEVHCAELALARLALADYLEPVHSYLSVVELGLYDSTVKTYGELRQRGIEPHSEEWNAAIAEVIRRQSAAMEPRLFPEIPAAKYLCFYPMDRKRAEEKNWYQVPMAERQRMMHEHGLIGRRYADSVRQIITGSIGFDDWEWGVDLFADDPLVFKKLIYEMRFDEVSAVYALFGTFYVGLRASTADLGRLMSGEL